MIRRIVAMIGIAVVIGLAVALMWRVHLHRERSRMPPDEPALVRKIFNAHAVTS